jgi:hypothetical protein
MAHKRYFGDDDVSIAGEEAEVCRGVATVAREEVENGTKIN